MMHNTLPHWDAKRLRRLLSLIFLGLAIPTVILIYQAWSQLKWEAFHRHWQMADELALRIDRRFGELVDIEEKRPYTDYSFLNVAGDPAANFLQRSPLSNYPDKTGIPGVLGYFQVDPDNNLTTPLLPEEEALSTTYGISDADLMQRKNVLSRLREILSRNQLVSAREATVGANISPVSIAAGIAEQPAAVSAPLNESLPEHEVAEQRGRKREADTPDRQAAFDKLFAQERAQRPEKKKQATTTLGRVEDLKLDTPYEPAVESYGTLQNRPLESGKRLLRKERNILPEQKQQLADEVALPEDKGEMELGITIFESEIDTFHISMLESGHFVLYRKVWRDGHRYIQGLLIEPAIMLKGLIDAAFRETGLSAMSHLAVAYQGDLLAAFSGEQRRDYLSRSEGLRGALLYQARLSAPLDSMELIFTIDRLPPGPGASVITWVAVILVIVLCSGFYLIYRLGLGQINLARQQQDFVSAISHELKTPLTSIRMYGEMLREGWADEKKKLTYYNFIHDESERLSRLIGNVLQLARMTRNELHVELKPMRVAELLDMMRSKIDTYIEKNTFSLRIDCDDQCAATVIRVDADYLNQIIINLVDNAIKFSRRAEQRQIDIGCHKQRDGNIVLSVRDYGPGIARDQMKKIFRLFYRSENELTRETVGTGIGLALVNQLCQAMNARIDVVNHEPGAEFRITFPADG